MVYKTKAKKRGGHVHVRFYAGPDGEHLAYLGKLCFLVGEWRLFGAILLLGVDKSRPLAEVITEGFLSEE